ncbi:exoribonuclease II [Maricurvus nonylphenolicus]|uniref:VacB/RNase II family 3'-5' exoribonuclease n=1 Tax=Maricurvus nonylphenolicus TaxID=1008307 RepID=UPI0036F235C2
MLDANALSQLSQLKQDIRADKNFAEGNVRGTMGRFGFVVMDDGREAFLPPDEMSRVFPGDRVEISYEEDDKGKLTATLEKLINSETKDLIGQYVVRGKGHFIATDMPQLNRWIFLPPKARGNAKADDYLHCRISRHPFEDGKGQAKLVKVLGQADTVGIEHQVTVLKHQLENSWSDKQEQQTKALLEETLATEGRRDATDIPFVTIDSATTKDMDDGLFITATDSGWTLQVAIADPSSGINLDSALGKAALSRGNTAYLPGGAVTMLPDTLSNTTYSLVEGETRPAWLFDIQINKDGTVAQFDYEPAIIQSRHKLTYTQVAEFLEQDNKEAVPADCQELLSTLTACAEARTEFRRNNMLLMEERDDYELKLNDKKHIDHIERQQRNKAQQVVEEAMLVTNACAGETFAKHPNTGIFSAHQGFREEKHEDIKKVLQEDFPELAEIDFTSAEGYKQLINTMHSNPEAAKQLSAFRLMLRPGELTLDARPHMGLGMEYYATVTSPIRRYNDFYNHIALAAIRDEKKLNAPSEEDLQNLQAQIGKTRQSARDLENWLIRLYMEPKVGESFEGRIIRVNNQGVTVKLLDSGITGFVKVGSKEDSYKFDALRMTLGNDDNKYELDQDVSVKLSNVNHDRKQINFEFV